MVLTKLSKICKKKPLSMFLYRQLQILKWQKFLPFGNTYRSYKAFKALLTNFLDPNDKNRVSLICHRNFSHLQMANVLLFQMGNAFGMIEKTSSEITLQRYPLSPSRRGLKVPAQRIHSSLQFSRT